MHLTADWFEVFSSTTYSSNVLTKHPPDVSACYAVFLIDYINYKVLEQC